MVSCHSTSLQSPADTWYNLQPRKLDYYELDPESLGFLYRVQLPNSATYYHEDVGFYAQGSLPNDPEFTNIRSLRTTLTEHFNWRSQVLSPFISVFDDEVHAENWALSWSLSHGNQECTIYRIDPAEMEDACIYEALWLIQDLNLYIPMHVNVDGEYLILGEIPVEAILEYWEVSPEYEDSDDIGEDEEEEREDSGQSDEGGSSDDGYYDFGVDEYY